MRSLVTAMIALLTVSGTAALADEQTKREVPQTILDSSAYAKRTNMGRREDYSADGTVEFRSGGGVMHEVSRDDAAGEFDERNIDVYHVKVTTLGHGKAAVAHYYSQGTKQPKGATSVANCFTRATQMFVNKGGAWKVRSTRWSAVLGGSGTSQTSLREAD